MEKNIKYKICRSGAHLGLSEVGHPEHEFQDAITPVKKYSALHMYNSYGEEQRHR